MTTPPRESSREPGTSGDDRGATSVEYALMVLFIAAVVITVVGLLGLDVISTFTPVETGIDGVAVG